MLASRGLVQILPKSSLDRRTHPTPRRLRNPQAVPAASSVIGHRIDALAMKITAPRRPISNGRGTSVEKTHPYSCLLTTARLRFSPRGVPSPRVRAFEARAFLPRDVGFAEPRPEPPRAPRGLHSRAGNDRAFLDQASAGSLLPPRDALPREQRCHGRRFC